MSPLSGLKLPRYFEVALPKYVLSKPTHQHLLFTFIIRIDLFANEWRDSAVGKLNEYASISQNNFVIHAVDQHRSKIARPQRRPAANPTFNFLAFFNAVVDLRRLVWLGVELECLHGWFNKLGRRRIPSFRHLSKDFRFQ